MRGLQSCALQWLLRGMSHAMSKSARCASSYFKTSKSVTAATSFAPHSRTSLSLGLVVSVNQSCSSCCHFPMMSWQKGACDLFRHQPYPPPPPPPSLFLLCSYASSVPTDRTMPTSSFLLMLHDMQPMLSRQGTPCHGRSLVSWANSTCVWRVPCRVCIVSKRDN
jgi:hypothetical protein